MEIHLGKFIKPQEKKDYETALVEIKDGRKRSHGIGYVFLQLALLDFNNTSRRFLINNLSEASNYQNHPGLGKRLVEIGHALLELVCINVTHIMDSPDNIKSKSSMTFFLLFQVQTPFF